MKTFYEELEERNLLAYLYWNNFKKVIPIGGLQFAEKIKDIVDSGYSVYLDEDCDIDGYLSVLSLKTMFDAIGHKNYTIPLHVYKRHGVGIEVMKTMLHEGKYKYYIITDSSTNATDVFDLFLQHPEVQLICVDHHMSTIDRSIYKGTNVLIINPKLDSFEKGSEVLSNDLSACALISLLIDCTVKRYFIDSYLNLKGAHWIYGYITLYSDSCKFSWYNIAYAQWVLHNHYPYPPLVEAFMTEYNTLDRNFVSWRLAPRLNAVLRAEYFTIAYDLFYDTERVVSSGVLQKVEEIYEDSKLFVVALTNNSRIIERDNFVVGIIPNEPRARNYTGLVANALSGKYNKPVMTLMSVTSDMYEGSVRDLYSRDLLSRFKTVIEADGHLSAFGVKIKKDNLDNDLYLIDRLLENVHSDTGSEGVILMDWSYYSSNDENLRSDLSLMASYNEYSGQGLPVAYAELPIKSNMRFKYGNRMTKIYWGEIELLLFDKYITVGDTAIVQPMYPNKLVVKNVHYKLNA